VIGQSTTPGSGFGAFFAVLGIAYVVMLIAFGFAWAKIISKAGYSAGWVLVGLIPFVNLVMFFVFAFSRWPVLDGPSSGGAYGYTSPGYTPPGYTPSGYTPPGHAPPGYVPPGYKGPGYPPTSPPAPPR
jgi:hypothetical protein